MPRPRALAGSATDDATNDLQAEGTQSRASAEASPGTGLMADGAASDAPGGGLTAPEAQPVEPGASDDQLAAPGGTSAAGATAERQVLAEDGTGPLPVAMLPLLSAGFLLAGLALVVLRLAGRRLGT